jgi:hypothetical protein
MLVVLPTGTGRQAFQQVAYFERSSRRLPDVHIVIRLVAS